MKNRFSRGFTLIELLVVIAIIGILSAVVLASLSTARNKGKDASAMESMESIRASAEICYNGGANCGSNTYGTAGGAGTAGYTTAGATAGTPTGVCTDADVVKLLKATAAQTGTTAFCSVGLSGASYVANVVLNGGSTFCIDSNGFAGSTTPGSIVTAASGAVKCQ